MHANPTEARFNMVSKIALQNKFQNLLSISLSSYTPKLKVLIKMLIFSQIVTSFRSDKVMTLSFNH